MSLSVEPPLRFNSQQPSSSPGFSSPPQSPTHVLQAHSTPASPQPPPPPSPPPPAMDVSTHTPPPAGQDHDRGDEEMQGGEEAGSHVASANTVAVEVAAVDEDAMDVTPDTHLSLSHSSPSAQEAAISTPILPTPDDAANAQPIEPPPPPPPPPPVEQPVRSDSESSDDDDNDDDDSPPWHPLQEDMSAPDEEELKDIEEGTEHSALDHEYWESKAFLPLEEPEYAAGESGRIHFSIDAFNGTRENPNHELVMKSEVVTIGGHQWQIKFYPKGNDTDYLSVYLECLSVMDKKNNDQDEAVCEDLHIEPRKNEQGEKIKVSSDDARRDSQADTFAPGVSEGSACERIVLPSLPVEPHHAPLPLLGSKTMSKRNSVAAQVSVVLYNPTEPRVHFSKTALHRFCKGSPDWGWTRFHGPCYDLHHRMRGQRMALLRDDKLAFTAYVRVVEDETDCLWEHPSRENPWDSFAMTGLQGLALGENASAPGGNMISAVASWMLFKPFRELLYSIHVADPEQEPFLHPKPLVTALQKVLYMLRTQVDPGAGAVALDDVLGALEWYGIHERLDKLDIMETWEVLRLKLEEELQDTPHDGIMQTICGPKRNYSIGMPSYRVPVVGVESMQEAVNQSKNFIVGGQFLPALLTIEMERQEFDLKTHSYVKVLNKVTLDDRIAIGNTSYTLYGFVVHKQTLQSYVYQPILRPEGPGSRWYSYSDSKAENQVKCLTKSEAIDAHEGKLGTEKIFGNEPVAYIAMYIRDDATKSAFTSDPETEKWDVPEWIKAEVEKNRSPGLSPPMPPPPIIEPVSEVEQDKGKESIVEIEPPKYFDFQVIESRAFSEHEGPGLFHAFDAKWQASELVHTLQLSSRDRCEEIADKLMRLLDDTKDRRQLKFWFLDPIRGSYDRPNLLSTGKIEFSSGSYDRYTDSKEWTLEQPAIACRRIWVHVTDFDKLPELPKEEEKEQAGAPPEAQIENVNSQLDLGVVEPTSHTPPPQMPPQSEDTPMSEPDAAQPEQLQPHTPEVEPLPPAIISGGGDTAMGEVESNPVANPPAIDAIIPSPAPGDTEMGGTQEYMPPPPPPPVDIPAEFLQPPPPARPLSPEPPPDEIYFFLKFWNPESQALEPRGSHIALKSARVDDTIVTLLDLPAEDKKKMEIWEEEELSNTRTIKHRRNFAQVDLHNCCIIIVGFSQTDEQRSALAARAAFADPQAYLAFRSFARNFPHQLNGHFTYNYFSSQYYKGDIVNGHRHGHGVRIYHSGATYDGTFQLGQRHGHGFYTFQNGNTYDGDWVANQQHGTGTFIEAATGNTYVGGWKHDKKFGEGVTHWRNAEESERLCRICWDEPAEAAFYDCGHVVACLLCAREVQICPVCRKRVLSSMKLYYVA